MLLSLTAGEGAVLLAWLTCSRLFLLPADFLRTGRPWKQGVLNEKMMMSGGQQSPTLQTKPSALFYSVTRCREAPTSSAGTASPEVPEIQKKASERFRLCSGAVWHTGMCAAYVMPPPCPCFVVTAPPGPGGSVLTLPGDMVSCDTPCWVSGSQSGLLLRSEGAFGTCECIETAVRLPVCVTQGLGGPAVRSRLTVIDLGRARQPRNVTLGGNGPGANRDLRNSQGKRRPPIHKTRHRQRESMHYVPTCLRLHVHSVSAA